MGIIDKARQKVEEAKQKMELREAQRETEARGRMLNRQDEAVKRRGQGQLSQEGFQKRYTGAEESYHKERKTPERRIREAIAPSAKKPEAKPKPKPAPRRQPRGTQRIRTQAPGRQLGYFTPARPRRSTRRQPAQPSEFGALSFTGTGVGFDRGTVQRSELDFFTLKKRKKSRGGGSILDFTL